MRELILFLALWTAGVEAQTCTADAAKQSAAATLDLQSRLLASSVPSMDTEVPLALRPLVHQFKQSLIQTVDLALHCNNPDPARIQFDLAALLHANRAPKPDPPPRVDSPEYETEVYGNNLHVAVKFVPEQPGLLSIQLTYEIECGRDNILFFYRHTVAGYRRELLWHNPDLNSVGDAFGDFFLSSLVPPDNRHRYLVAVAHGTPWCTSNLSEFHVDLLAPATERGPQTRLAHLDQGFRREDDPRIRVTSDGFDLRVTANSIAGAIIMRPGVFRYRTTSGTLERVQPIALNARDFVDEWLQLPWSEASRWTLQPTADLKAFRDRFDYTLHPNGGDFIDDFGPVRACPLQKDTFQVELDILRGEKADRTELLYAKVRQGPNSFTMVSVSPKSDPECTGANLMKKPTENPT